MARKGIIVLMVLFLVLGSAVSSFAAAPVNERLAKYEVDYEGQIPRLMNLKSSNQDEQLRILQDLKILRGTGNGLELDKGLTRVEGLVIYLRLLGGEYPSNKFRKEEAGYKTGFTDVPDWALDNINYLHANNLVNGLDNETLGANHPMTAEQFTTLILRGLGYKDSKGEFAWNQSLDKAVELQILTESEKSEIQKDKFFTREEMAKLAYNSLFTRIKDEPKLLISDSVLNLSNEGFAQIFYIALSPEEVEEFNRAKGDKEYSVFPDNPEKKKILLDKIQDYFDTCRKYYKFYLDDKEVDIKVTRVNDVGSLRYSDDIDEFMRIFRTTIRVDTPITGEIEAESYQGWSINGNKLRITSDTNYFGAFYHDLILEYMRTKVGNLIHSPRRLGENFDVGGLEDFKEKHNIDDHYDKVGRRIFSYDGVKLTDSISIQRAGSLDYHMYIDLMK